MKKRTITIVAAVSAALLLGGGVMLLKDDAAQMAKSAEIREFSISEKVRTELDDISDVLEEATEETTESEDISEDSEPVCATGTLPADVMQQLKDTAKNLKTAYPDAIGWLYIPDTAINYPLMQGNDNDYYLHHAYDGSKLTAGSIFLDYRCENRLLNPLNVVYGHNMKNGSMFAGLLKYGDTAYLDEHRYGWLATESIVYRIDFFSLAKADREDAIYDGSQPITDWMPRLRSLSIICNEMTYTEADQFISLSTCSYEFKNARTVLTGKLVEMRED